MEKDITVQTPMGHSFMIPQNEQDNVYYFKLTDSNLNFPNVRQVQLKLFQLHLALGHPNFTELMKIVIALNIKPLLVKGLLNPGNICMVCKRLKTYANQVPKESTSYKPTKPFQKMHIDNLVGLTLTPGNHTQYLFSICESSKFMHVRLIKHKSESKDHIIFLKQLAKSFDSKLDIMMSDSAKELFVDHQI